MRNAGVVDFDCGSNAGSAAPIGKKPVKGHGHKGRRSKREGLKRVPLLYMNKGEIDQTFADASGWPERLQLIRDGKNDETRHMARLLLCRPGLDDLLIVVEIEAGDGEGCKFIEWCMNQIRLSDALLPGESVRMDLVEPTASRPVAWPVAFQPSEGEESKPANENTTDEAASRTARQRRHRKQEE